MADGCGPCTISHACVCTCNMLVYVNSVYRQLEIQMIVLVELDMRHGEDIASLTS